MIHIDPIALLVLILLPLPYVLITVVWTYWSHGQNKKLPRKYKPPR